MRYWIEYQSTVELHCTLFLAFSFLLTMHSTPFLHVTPNFLLMHSMPSLHALPFLHINAFRPFPCILFPYLTTMHYLLDLYFF